jgi:hypothetical protein
MPDGEAARHPMLERSEVPDVPEAPDGIAIIGLDHDGEAYTQH